MPLHLLGKKSWNVYNAANIARVRADEAEADAKREAEEQRMQEEDAARRTAILRGETPPPISKERSLSPVRKRSHDAGPSGSRKRPRPLRGEDETDMEMRMARRDLNPDQVDRQPTTKTSDAAIVDERGHVSIFAPPDAKNDRDGPDVEENPRARRERLKQERLDRQETEALQGVKFASATSGREAWYVDSKGERDERRDAFGNVDPGRAGRDTLRTSAMDPMAVMARAQRDLKAVKREREEWRAERAREVDVAGREEKRRHGGRHRHGHERDKHSGRDRKSSGPSSDRPRRDGRRGERRDERSTRDERRDERLTRDERSTRNDRNDHERCHDE